MAARLSGFIKTFKQSRRRSRQSDAIELKATGDSMSDAAQLMRFWLTVSFAFLLGVLAVWKVEAIGTLYYSEILLVAIFPFLLPVMIFSKSVRRHRKVIVLGLLYLAAQIFSDLYRHTPANDYLRGWARLGLTIMMFTLTSGLFVRSAAALVAFVIGAHLVGPVTYLLQGAVFGENNVYKLQVGPSVSMAVFILLSLKPKIFKLPSVLLAVGAGILAFVNSSRSLAGVTLLSIVTTWVGRFRTAGDVVSRKKLVLPAVIFVLAGWGIFQGYRYAASSGRLGNDELERFYAQSKILDAENFSLLSGRVEILFAGPKVLSSPVIGHGSWAKDVDYVYNRALELGFNPENMVNDNPAEPGLIPAHSHLFSAWLEAGVAGFVFWGFGLFMTVDILIRQRFIRHPALGPLLNYLLLYFGWDLLFSPYGAERRLWDGFLLAWIAAVYYKAKDTAGVADGGTPR